MCNARGARRGGRVTRERARHRAEVGDGGGRAGGGAAGQVGVHTAAGAGGRRVHGARRGHVPRLGAAGRPGE
eukprot:3374911-Pyramimonas_sp.AAC.1